MTTATVPVTVTDEAATRISGLALWRQFERMLEHTKQTVSGLKAIKVTLGYDPDPGVDPGIVIWSYREHPGGEDDPTDRTWGAWKVSTYPPHICQHFVMLSIYGEPDDPR